jgi:hypothetical protein
MKLLLPLLLVAGVVLMIPFETTVTRILGVAALLAFVVCGLFAIATPEYLSRTGDD